MSQKDPSGNARAEKYAGSRSIWSEFILRTFQPREAMKKAQPAAVMAGGTARACACRKTREGSGDLLQKKASRARLLLFHKISRCLLHALPGTARPFD